MNEFSPGVVGVGIQKLLQTLAPHSGNKNALLHRLEGVGKIADTTDLVQRKKRAGNVLIGLSECGLFDLSSSKFTELGETILSAPSPADATRIFAKHILLNLHGYTLVDVVRLARERGDPVSLDLIRGSLRSRAFAVTTNEGNASKLRGWLEEAGVVDDKWNFDEKALTDIGGLGSALLKEFGTLSHQQIVLLNKIREQAMLRPLEAWLELSPILDLINLEFGKNFLSEGRLRAKVVKPLADSLWIETRGTGKNQGGNAGDVRPLPKLLSLSEEIPIPTEAGIPRELRAKLSTPPDKLFKDLESPYTHTKGIALELLALNVLMAIGLQPVGFRVRAAEAGNVETDLTANGVHLHYSRWLVQCKNTAELKHEHVAREIGLATVLRSHVVLMITTGSIAAHAQILADQAARQSYLQILMIDGSVLKKFRRNGAHEIITALRKQAQQVLTLKRTQESGLL